MQYVPGGGLQVSVVPVIDAGAVIWPLLLVVGGFTAPYAPNAGQVKTGGELTCARQPAEIVAARIASAAKIRFM